MPTRRYASGLRVWLALGTVYLVWGSTYFGIAIAIESIPPFLMLAARFTLAGGLLLAWEWLRSGSSFRRPTRREVRDSAVVGALLLGVGNGFVAFGEQTVASGIAAILIGMVPLWLAVFGWLYFRERLSRLALVGVVIGLIGVGVLVWPAGAGANAFDGLGIAALLVSPLAWSHGSLFAAHRARLPRSGVMASALQMLAGAAVLVVEGAVTGELGQLHPAAVTLRSVITLAYLTAIGSMLAFTAYAWLLRHAPLSLVGTYAYVNPVVAVALGAAFLAEPISPRTLIASIVIITAVAMIVTARGRSTDRPAPEPAAQVATRDEATSGAAGPIVSSAAPRRAPSD
ncbi:MAG TPA: EamA family transporter [Candidatus Binatus sp.]|nr:EamA family transporter [Candidatus Binatus sp.]